ncbi:FG-GAP repeat domain-containing protein [Jannaschia pohangensis]|uniref:Repeat domain-containing protein n=1 Tax=Jannaschia pohangensis TaxID=390807 RepID=A0A1I3N5B3_9RHOB|nr:VCBS repeat-containing protein [Jannaschia pohangensis]SFJ04411.1 hypothetical protein SAMN04488095_2055 [Jannaschia pohangensis]
MILRAALVCVLAATGAQACRVSPETQAIAGSMTQSGDQAAWYRDPTDIYGHGIMGNIPDALTLVVASPRSANSCGVFSVAAGDGHVFEDTAPRLVDVTGDGIPEVIAVRSSVTQGAQLVVYAEGPEDRLTVLAETPYIGRRNRWLAPAAWADLDGDGAVEIAFVDRPHLAKTLRIWRFSDGALTEVAAASGVTNHRIGDEIIHGGLRTCDGGPEMILASADWTEVLALRFDGREIKARRLGTNTPTAMQEAMNCSFP